MKNIKTSVKSYRPQVEPESESTKSHHVIKRLFVFFTNVMLFIIFYLIGNAPAPWLEATLRRFFVEQAIANNDFSGPSNAQVIWLEVMEASPLFIAAALLFVLNGYFLKKYRKTLGQKLFRLDLIKIDNECPSLFSMMILRNLIFVLSVLIPAVIMLIIGLVVYPSIPHHFSLENLFFSLIICNFIDYLFIFRKDRRCLHDLIAGTKVVEET